MSELIECVYCGCDHQGEYIISLQQRIKGLEQKVSSLEAEKVLLKGALESLTHRPLPDLLIGAEEPVDIALQRALRTSSTLIEPGRLKEQDNAK